ncbi:nucleotidyl transferase AbiEii/AbiGii toxin family protein [Ruminococcus hominis]|uniref:Nucleotidyl transferase AbiEii/AbiGii toxin family protein n=1 Tax=Ruminococcus hominis TaxID=2763065 RepID=A0ABR7GBA1_9FIRM|nr:nucleotidyl transferase AbiEii/AbiGii toxin family protein [Ruminococcus hominis]MBC5684348.1 nucleotidyl transferase AbiEii/AbiGii toxin family protein [Ruminococcus hominis]
MSSKAMSLKGKIKNYAKNNNIAAQVILQNYMFERFLERLSLSEYREKFVVKGGMLIAAIVGLDTRSTMDLDTTLRNMPLTEEQIYNAIRTICDINIEDDVIFEIQSVNPIRKDDVYGGYCVRIDAVYDTIVTPLSIDVSTGDVITPSPVKYDFSGIFDDELKITLWGYNIETVIAEKVETILSRGVFTTRPRDYYDVYVLVTTQKYDKVLFKEALNATAIHRGTAEKIEDTAGILTMISQSNELKSMWNKYRKKFTYAEDISYEMIMKVLKNVLVPVAPINPRPQLV